MAALEKLIEYRRTYVNRADEKINKTYLSMIDEAIAELSTTQHRLKRLESIYSGIDGRYVDNIIELPDIVFDRFLNYCLERELSMRDINELARLIIIWEKKTDATIQEYNSIKFYKQLLDTPIPQEANDATAPFVSLPCIGLAPGANATPAFLPSGVDPVLVP